MMSAETTGNIQIFEIEDEKDDELGVTDTLLKEKFEKNEAKIVNHFFKKELLELGGNVVRKPDSDQEVDTLLITFSEKRAISVRRNIDELKGRVRKLPEEEVQLPDEKIELFSKTQAEFDGHDDVLLLHDAARGKVLIVGRSKEIVDKAASRLQGKARSGFPSSRQNRTVLHNSSDELKSVQASNSTPTSNIDKYKKLNIPRVFQSAAESGSDYTRSGRGSSDPKAGGVRAGSKRSYNDPSSSEKTKFEITLKNGFVLKVYNASITKLDVDVIVNAANDNMMHGGGVARVISEAAGWKLDDDSKAYVEKNGLLPVTENIVTTAGNLTRYKAVIHAVGPEWYKYREKVQCLDDLFDCIYNILDRCKERKYRTVGMSAISAGIFGVPKELCANIYVHAAAQFSKNLGPSECPRELHIVDIDTNILKLIEESSKRWAENPESLNPRVCVPEFLEKNPESKGFSGGHRSGGWHGRRSAGHGRGSQGREAIKRNDDNDNGTSVDTGHKDGHHHDFGGQWTGDTGESSQRNKSLSIGSTLKLKCDLKKLQVERFKWGGTANLFLLKQTVTVKIYEGSIDRIRGMDAIVCGTDESLQQRGFIADALSRAGGYYYKKACEDMASKHGKKANPGDVFKCRAGTLGAEWVLQAVCKRIVDANYKETDAYQKCIVNIFRKADKNSMKKIALPLLATGTLQTNKEKLKECGKALLQALDVYLDDSESRNRITDVHLVNNNELVSTALLEVFDEAITLYGENKIPEDKGTIGPGKRNKLPEVQRQEMSPPVRGRRWGGGGRKDADKRDERSPGELGLDNFKRSRNGDEITTEGGDDLSDDGYARIGDLERDEDTGFSGKGVGAHSASKTGDSAHGDSTAGSGSDKQTKQTGNLLIIEN